MEIPRLDERQFPWNQESLLILHTDGLGSRWKLNAYPGLIARHPSVIAGVLYRDFQRNTDDVTILAVRENPLPGRS